MTLQQLSLESGSPGDASSLETAGTSCMLEEFPEDIPRGSSPNRTYGVRILCTCKQWQIVKSDFSM